MNYSKCSTTRTDKIIKVDENGRSFIIANPQNKSVVQIAVDNCLISGADIRCDWLFDITVPNKCFYVELKGVDVNHAIDQLWNTILATQARCSRHKKSCFVVASASPRTSSTKIQNEQKRFIKQHNATLVIKSRTHTEIV